jgi:hypothetical protein
MTTIKTGSWFAAIPADHIRISISRGSPHWLAGWRGSSRTLAGLKEQCKYLSHPPNTAGQTGAYTGLISRRGETMLSFNGIHFVAHQCVCREAESERSDDEVRRGPHVI